MNFRDNKNRVCESLKTIKVRRGINGDYFYEKINVKCNNKAKYKVIYTTTQRNTGKEIIITKYVCGIHVKIYQKANEKLKFEKYKIEKL